MRCLLAFAVFAWATSLWCVASADDGAAALLPFQGPQAAKVRQIVQQGLRAQEVRVVPLKQVSSVAKKTQGYAKQAARLDAKVLVRSRLRRSEGRWTATTEVRNAKGQRVKKLETGSSSLSRLSNRIVAQLLKTGLMPKAAAAAAAAAPAAAPPPKKPPPPRQPRVVVRPFDGAQSAKVRSAAVRGLRGESLELYPNADFVAAAKSLGADPSSPGGHVAPAASLAVSGLFEGDVVREDGVWSAYVRLVEGRSDEVVSQHYYDGNTLSALLKSVQARVGPDFRKDVRKLGVLAPATVAVGAVTVPPATSPPEKSTKEPAKKTPKPKSKKAKRPAAVDIEADFRVVRRTLRWNDDIRSQLRDYTLNAAPGVSLKFLYYPGAHFTDGVGAMFGLHFEWERLFAIKSTRPDGATFPTGSEQFLIGLHWRYPTGIWEPYIVLDYGVHTFRFGVSDSVPPGGDITAGVPSVRYELVRVGAGFRVALGKQESFTIGASIAFRGVFDVGAIGTNVWFPQAKANGMDVGLVFGFVLPLGFEVRIGGDYRRYGFDLNPVPPNPPYVAGGALDQYLGGTLGFAWRR